MFNNQYIIFYREVTKKYISKGIFTDFQRNSTETIIRKSKNFKQRNFIRNLGPITDT